MRDYMELDEKGCLRISGNVVFLYDVKHSDIKSFEDLRVILERKGIDYTPPKCYVYGRPPIPCDKELIKKIVFGKGITEIPPMMFMNCPNLEEVVLPEGLLYINGCAFADCENLKTVRLPSTLKGVGRDAFSGTAIQELVAPKGTIFTNIDEQGISLIRRNFKSKGVEENNNSNNNTNL